jgi:hypothetical protein
MNTVHPEYGVFTIDDYIEKAKTFCSIHTVKNIFIASDNEESIQKFKERFDSYNIHFIKDTFRCDLEKGDNRQHLENINNADFIRKIVTEALILSKCGFLIHRVSDFANFSILFSSSFSEIVHL